MHALTAELRRLIRAFSYSWRGIQAAWRDEAAFRVEILACAGLLPVALLMEVSAAERALLIMSLLLVPLVELLNTAIEAAIDRISEATHPLSAKAKDAGSAAVLLSLLIAASVWGCILLH